MEKLLLAVAAIVLLAIAALFFLGYRSQSGEPPGLVDGRLAPCPPTPNCVCSEDPSDADHGIEPVAYPPGQSDRVLADLETAVHAMGGQVRVRSSDYLAATFTSSVFRFVDDLEARIDRDRQIVQLRSASRVGRSDLGANRKRIEQLKRRLETP